jgi:ankyrin repeat protein
MSGDSRKMQNMVAEKGLDVLLGTTPHPQAGNTCLHIASFHGHREFCMDVLHQNWSLITAFNEDGETPLLAAITRGHTSLASTFLHFCLNHEHRDAILCQDKHRCNALHHAIRSDDRELAMELIRAVPELSRAVNSYHESPMFISVMRDYEDITKVLLEIEDSADGGTFGFNALHAAIRNGNSGETYNRNILEIGVRNFILPSQL